MNKKEQKEYKYYMILAAQASALGNQMASTSWMNKAQELKKNEGKIK